MRNFAKLAAAGALSLAMVSGSAFAVTPAAGSTQPKKVAVTKAPAKKAATHAAKKAEKKAQ